jgi:hypothetical protein
MEYMQFDGTNADEVAAFVVGYGFLARVDQPVTPPGIFAPPNLHVRESLGSQEFWVWSGQYVVVDGGISILSEAPVG